jgi:hypothetical protein
MGIVVKSTAKRILVEGLGWILVLLGVAALVLPGPGLLALFAGVALLSTQYEWAERRLEPVKKAALRTAADSVKTWPRILMSFAGVCWLIGLGIYWGINPQVVADGRLGHRRHADRLRDPRWRDDRLQLLQLPRHHLRAA